MKIECPNCKLSGQASDANIPPEGRYMDCPRCKTNFFIQKSVTANWADTLTDCPECGYSTFSGDRFDICPTCGLVAKTYNERKRQQPAARNAGPHAVGTAPADSESIRQDLERMQREEEKRRQLRAAGDGSHVPVAQPEPEIVVLPPAVKYLGWAFVAVGLLVLGWGGKGFYDYLRMTPAEAVTSAYDDPPGPAALYFSHGLFATLRIILGIYAVAAGSQFLKLRPWARKGVEAAAWGGVAYIVLFETVNLVGWIRRSSDSASFLYYVAGFADTLLMVPLWSAPFLAAVWFLRGEVMDEAFGE